MKKILSIILLIVLSAFSAKSQITTSTLTTAQYVQNVLLGPGVTASNITYTGLPRMIASYTAPAITNLGITKGVYLTCGSNGLIPTEEGPDGPSSAMQSVDQGQPGDASLNALTTSGTQDASVLEFDFVPQSDTVRFRYVFGSEEYNDFVNSSFNDVFAFILSGVSTPLAATNIALIPGTSTPITINNVNNGYSSGTSTGPCSNCTFYRDNINGSIDCIYDGLTVVLTAKHKVLCGETYHIKIAIADAGDGALDSGVFLEAGSFSSQPPLNVYTVNSNSNIPDSILVEDCNTYCAYFIRNSNISQVDSFNLQVTGNAILGSDYNQTGNPTFTWPTKLIFAANQDTIKICNINALQDNLTEGTDTLKFEMSSFATSTVSCLVSNSIKFNLYIKDYVPITIGQNDVSICSGTSVLLNAAANNGYPSYTYTISAPTVNTPTLNTGPINSITNYSITVNDICNKPVTKQIIITPVAIPTVTVNDTILCAGNTGILYAAGASTYSWSSGPTSNSITINPTTTTNYTVIGSVGTCTNSAVSTVTVIGQALVVTGNNSICSGQSSMLSASGGSLYTWSTGITTPTITVTPSVTSTYTVTSVAASCTNTSVYTVSVTPIPVINVSGTTICPGQNGTLTATGATSYSWSTGATGNSININPTVNTTYTVIGTVAPSCTNMAVCTASIITDKPDLHVSSPIVFCLDSVKQIPVSITNGNPPYNISWLIPSGGLVPFDTLNNTYYFTQSVSPSSENYTITVIDQCLYKDTITVSISTVDCDILVPNVVTPNGDGVNEYFIVRGMLNFPGSSLMVFNRWGNKIYSSDDYKNDWKPNVTDGTYFYIINVTDGRKFNGYFQVFKN